MTALTPLLDDVKAKRDAFDQILVRKFPGRDRWSWARAIAAARGEDVRRNDDQSDDAALAADTEISDAFEAYIAALHVFYRARDGEHGILGPYNPPNEKVAENLTILPGAAKAINDVAAKIADRILAKRNART